MLNIGGMLSLGVFVNGRELPMYAGGFEEVIIVQNVALHVPQFRIIYLDSSDIISRMTPIIDGTPISIRMGIPNSDEAPYEFQFRSFSSPLQNTSSGPRAKYTIAGFLDTMRYLRGSAEGGKRGTSAQAIEEIANRCGLESLVDPTNDEMMWLSGSTSHCKWAAQVASHGWKDERSLMKHGLDEKKILHYANITDRIIAEPKATFWVAAQPQNPRTPLLHVHKWTPKSRAGILNNMFNYGSRLVEQSNSGATEVTGNVQATLISGNLEINKDLREQIGTVRREYVPPPSGNQHPKYNIARYQNEKLQAAFSTKLEVTIAQPGNLTLFDPVEVYISSESGSSQLYSGKYIVTAKARYATGTMYYEKYELCSQGRQADPGDQMVG